MTSHHVLDDVDRLIAKRGGRELLRPVYDAKAVAVTDFLYRSRGSTDAFMVLTDTGRVIINTGGGWEAPHTRRLFDAVCPGPTPYIITTQGHADHIGGVAAFREPGTVYVAHRHQPLQLADDARIAGVHDRLVSPWFPASSRDDRATRFAPENPDVPTTQDAPTPDLTFTDRLELNIGGTRFELVAGVGETIESAIVHLPDHGICFISNLLGPLFPHFPNLNTLRGQRYRWVEPYLATIRTLRELQPEVLLTGRGDPVRGAELIDRCLDRLGRAVDHVHRRTLERMNAGDDIWTIMREVTLPDELRVGEGYGKVSWGVRTIWESYVGWFHHQSTTELYDLRHSDVYRDVAELAGPAAVAERAWAKLDGGEPVAAIHLAEIALAGDASDLRARTVMLAAHESLLADGGDLNFWESGWLRAQIERWRTDS